MTKEEAIQILRDWDGYFIGHSSDDVNKALNIAIEALEQQPEDIANGIPFPKICDKDNSEIIKDLSKRVEALEKQMEEDKAEQLKKLNAELDYAKFRCTL